uniref:MarR family transcriptional regulator n=1 Tax=Thermorudis sp. TaxID=1969470 RepID=A0A7C2WHK8_9BACT
MTIYDPLYRRESRAARVGMALLRLSQAVKALTAAEVAGTGLTPVQAQALLFVRYTKPFLASVGRLAEALGVTHVTAIGVLDGLVRHGLVQKAPSPFDRRVTLLRLTPAGEDVCQRLSRFGHTLEEALAQLDELELEALERSLGAVVWSLREAGVLQVAEPCRGCIHFQENAVPGSPEPHRCSLIQRYLSEADARLACPDFTPAPLPR